MLVALCLPLLDLAPGQVPWPEIVRALGMLAGVLALGTSQTLLGTITLAMDTDELADATDPTT
ncbi:hypothetical protein [Corynebacterium lizhenjunii]|nr:hypothetical protein [Corynebacterium lizhenjunii]